MSRKWTSLALAAFCTLGAAGFVPAADDESPMAKLMEKVQAKNLVITKGVRTAVAYKKAQKDVSGAAGELAKLGKEAKADMEPAKKAKKTHAEWEKLMDDFVKESETFAELTAKDKTEQAEAKTAYKAVTKTCTACHADFRVDE